MRYQKVVSWFRGILTVAGICIVVAVGGTPPASAQGVAPTCPAGFQYKAGSTVCQAIKPATCFYPPQGWSSCYALSQGKCSLNTGGLTGACWMTQGGYSRPQGGKLPGSIPPTCPTGFAFRAASNDCYGGTTPVQCPSGYTMKAATGKCEKAPTGRAQ